MVVLESHWPVEQNGARHFAMADLFLYFQHSPKCISRISYASHEGLLGGRASLLLEVSKFKLTPCAGIKPLLWLIFAELEVGCSVAQNRAYNLLNKIAHAILQWLICSYGLLSVKAADHRYHLYTTALNEASFVYQPKGTLRHIHNKCR